MSSIRKARQLKLKNVKTNTVSSQSAIKTVMQMKMLISTTAMIQAISFQLISLAHWTL